MYFSATITKSIIIICHYYQNNDDNHILSLTTVRSSSSFSWAKVNTLLSQFILHSVNEFNCTQPMPDHHPRMKILSGTPSVTVFILFFSLRFLLLIEIFCYSHFSGIITYYNDIRDSICDRVFIIIFSVFFLLLS